MELAQLSNKRGIYSFYNGSQYIIYSTYYGVVAYSTLVDRSEENSVLIKFNICTWYGYWDLKRIINTGIKKLENRYIKKLTTIQYNIISNTDNSLENKVYLNFKLYNR